MQSDCKEKDAENVEDGVRWARLATSVVYKFL